MYQPSLVDHLIFYGIQVVAIKKKLDGVETSITGFGTSEVLEYLASDTVTTYLSHVARRDLDQLSAMADMIGTRYKRTPVMISVGGGTVVEAEITPPFKMGAAIAMTAIHEIVSPNYVGIGFRLESADKQRLTEIIEMIQGENEPESGGVLDELDDILSSMSDK